MAIIGIDLGTTNSLAAVWRNGKSELIPNAAGKALTPSVVSVDEDGGVLVGRAARDRLISHPERTAARFKRFMGTDKTYTLGSRTFTPEDLSSLILRSLREDAEAYLGETVEEAVVSVPAYFAEAQRAATKRAAALAGLKVERLVNEPSAAAVAGHISEGEEDKVSLVFDLGGGTLDVSLVERFGNVVSVTAVSGDNRLGGADFDLAIARGFCEDGHLDFDSLTPRQKELLIRQAETCKMALTNQEMVIMSVDDGTISAALTLSNEWLIRKCETLFRRMTAPIQRVFLDGGVSPRELDDLVMVGGSSHMPAVRRYIARFLRKEPVRDSRPDTAVALGAGICAGMKARVGDLRELVLTDVCPFTLGVARYNESEPGRDLMSPIIERNSVLPTSKMGIYYTVRDGQDRVDVRVYQGENRYCADNTLLGTLQISVPPAPRGEQSIRVRFTYDINGLLEVEVAGEAGQSRRLVLQNKDMTAAEAERRLQELSHLKLHPRDQEEYRAMVARGERLYAVTVGELREQVAEMLDWYQRVLSTQENLKIAKATKRLDRFFDQAEAYLGDAALPPPELSEDDEEDGL
ncbi:MAG: Hsp70 family protein [Oscillibacter sp.]|nr:Hsp70 family protein [Oscillibacter sp.]